MPAPRHLLVSAVVLGLTASACGRESEEERVRATLERFAAATAAKDYDALCNDVFSKQLVEEVRRTLPCELALKNSDLGSAQKPKLEVKRVKVDDKKATADVRSTAANQPASDDTVQLVQEDGGWRIIALSSR